MIEAHGIGGRADLPLPFTYAVVGAGVALLLSFVALGLLWPRPQLQEPAGRPLPPGLASALDAAPTRELLRALGLAAFVLVLLAAFAGADLATNATPYVVYVHLWVGVPLVSALLGPWWRLVNPVRTVHALVCRLAGLNPSEGMRPYPVALGYWPAAGTLAAFVWLELAAGSYRTGLPVLRTVIVLWFVWGFIGAVVFGSHWLDRADPLEVVSALFGRLGLFGRRPVRELIVRAPLSGLGSLPSEPGLVAVVVVLLGSTTFDAAAASSRWYRLTESSPVGYSLTATLGLVVVLLVVGAAYGTATWASGQATGMPRRQLPAAFAHSLVPIALAYFTAHYYSLLVLEGQRGLIYLSDPLATGDSNWLGLSHRRIGTTLLNPKGVALLQVIAVVVGHLVGVVLAHDRAISLFPRARAVVGQLPLLVLMLALTTIGLTLLLRA